MKYAVINNEGHVIAHDCSYQAAEDALNYQLDQDPTNAEEWEIIEQEWQYCLGCSFNSNTKIGGCPYYIDEGRKIYPCIKYGIIFKKLRRDIDKKK